MANEFIARKGLISSGSVNVSGSVTAFNFYGTASQAVSSSFATTSSYALNSGFPFSGSAIITGSLYVSGSTISGSFVGDGSGLDIASAVVSDIYTFVGNGATQLYVLSQSYYKTNVQVSVDGLVFTEGVDYTYTTGSITFIVAPPSSSNILVNALLNTKNNLTGSFTGSFIGDGRGLRNIPLAVEIDTYRFDGDGVTTNYSLSYPYGPDALFISVNGVTYSNPEDFVVSGTTLTFTEVPNSSSNILVRAFVTTSIIDSASLSISSSYALSSSFSTTASYALNAGAGSGFPFSGSAVITGSLLVIPTGSVGGITGSFSGSGAGLTDLRASIGIDNYVFVGDGSTTQYILSQSYIPTSLIVSVEGIGYITPDDYTMSGPTMSFVAAPPSESNVSIKAFLAVSSGSYINYTGSFIGDGYGLNNLRGSLAIDKYIFVGDGVTTDYTVSASYVPTSLNVTVGGLRYTNPYDYTVSANTVSFVQAPASQSVIVVDAFLVVSSGSVATFSGSFIGNAELTSSGHFTPSVTDIYDLGSPSKKWRSLYVSGSTIYLGSLELKDKGGTFAVANSSGVTLPVSGTFSGSFFGTSSVAENAISSSYATTASFASNVLKTKAGSVANTSFGGSPLTASVTFSTAFDNTNYAIAITGEDSRAWIVQSKTASGFIINSVSNTALTGTTYWTCTAYGEN